MLDVFLKSLKNICDYEIYSSHDFGVEFGYSNPLRIKSTPVRGVLVTPFLTLHSINYMIEHKLNFALTILPLPIFRGRAHKLTDIEYELLRALTNNNIGTLRLPLKWAYTSGFSYFLQTLGFNSLTHETISKSSDQDFYLWSIPAISFGDFLSTLSHLTNNWYALPVTEQAPKFIIVENEISLETEDLYLLKNNDVSTIFSFVIDSRNLQRYKEEKLNILFLHFVDFLNIALRKFSQMLQLEIKTKVVFQPQKSISLILPNEKLGEK